jgi:hypothetical protein
VLEIFAGKGFDHADAGQVFLQHGVQLLQLLCTVFESGITLAMNRPENAPIKGSIARKISVRITFIENR